MTPAIPRILDQFDLRCARLARNGILDLVQLSRLPCVLHKHRGVKVENGLCRINGGEYPPNVWVGPKMRVTLGRSLAYLVTQSLPDTSLVTRIAVCLSTSAPLLFASVPSTCSTKQSRCAGPPRACVPASHQSLRDSEKCKQIPVPVGAGLG